MRKVLGPVMATALVTLPAFAQHGGGTRVGGGGHFEGGHPGVGHFGAGPPRGPAPMRAAPAVHPRAPTKAPRGGTGYARPFVDERARWIGHDSGPRDLRYRIDRPWPHGRFPGVVGPGHAYRLRSWDIARHRFWLGSWFLVVAPADWAYVDDWSWPSDEVVLYEDPDHPGWYLAYNV